MGWGGEGCAVRSFPDETVENSRFVKMFLDSFAGPSTLDLAIWPKICLQSFDTS